MTDQIKHLEGEKNALERQIAKLDGDLTENDQATDQLIKKLKSSNLMLTQDKQVCLNITCDIIYSITCYNGTLYRFYIE